MFSASVFCIINLPFSHALTPTCIISIFPAVVSLSITTAASSVQYITLYAQPSVPIANERPQSFSPSYERSSQEKRFQYGLLEFPLASYDILLGLQSHTHTPAGLLGIGVASANTRPTATRTHARSHRDNTRDMQTRTTLVKYACSVICRVH